MNENNNVNNSISEFVFSVLNYVAGIKTGGILNLEPILKTHNYYVALKDKLFTEKIIKFVEELNSLNEKEKIELANFIRKLESDKEFQEKVSFALISYI